MADKQIEELVNQLKEQNTTTLYNLALKTYDNVLDLVEESLLLAGQRYFARSLFLAFTALEELGKAYYIGVLAAQILAGVTKENLQEMFLTVAKLFRRHDEKITAAHIAILVQDFLTQVPIQTEVFYKSIDEIKEDAIPSLVSGLTTLVIPLEKWLEKAIITTNTDNKGLTFDDRNHSLYVDFQITEQKFDILTPENIPRHLALYLLATSAKYVDSFGSYFFLIEEYLNGNEIAKKLLIQSMQSFLIENNNQTSKI